MEYLYGRTSVVVTSIIAWKLRWLHTDHLWWRWSNILVEPRSLQELPYYNVQTFWLIFLLFFETKQNKQLVGNEDAVGYGAIYVIHLFFV